MGEIEGRWLEAGKKAEMVLSIEMAKEKGISIIRTCGIWEVNRRRVNRWRSRLALGKKRQAGSKESGPQAFVG